MGVTERPNIADFASTGGKARAGSMTAEQRSEIAKKGGLARWKGRGKNYRAMVGQMLKQAREARRRSETGSEPSSES